MAFRIDENIVKGTIDNRVKGRVRGEIIIAGREKPLIIDLRGNAWADLAGCILSFSNAQPEPLPEKLQCLQSEQKGTIGDITASRKVREFEVPIEEALKMIRSGQKPPEHMANCLYLEWYSQRNGRVVIESSDYEMEISAPEWKLTPEDEEERAKLAASGMSGFLEMMTDSIAPHDQKSENEEWDEHDYEDLLKRSDEQTKKYGELLDKYGDSDDAQELIDQAMGWDTEPTEEDKHRIDEINAACESEINEPEPEPHREGIDWVRTENGDLRHPLQHQCYESCVRFRKNLSGEEQQNPEIAEFIFLWQRTAAKLAGALNSIARTGEVREAAFTVAYLKRALQLLHDTQAGLTKVQTNQSLDQDRLNLANKELFEIRSGILELMDQYRGD